MGFITFKPGARAERTCQFVRPGAISFLPASASGTRVGGELSLAYDDGPARKLKVWMTWDALDRLRTELARHDIEAGDAAILHRVLKYWGAEEYERRVQAGEPLPSEGLLLALSGGPASYEPRRLLVGCGLLPMRSS